MAGQKTARRLGVHPKLLLQIWDKFLFKRGSPRTVICRIGPNVMAERALCFEIDIYHLGTFPIRHLLCHVFGVAKWSEVCAAVAVDTIDSRVSLSLRFVVAWRQDD